MLEICGLIVLRSFQERKYAEALAASMEAKMQQVSDSHRSRIAQLERKFLQDKQQLLRGAR